MVLMETNAHQKRSLISTLIKQRQKFCLNLHYNGDNGCLFVNRKVIYKFKIDNKNVNFPTHFRLGSIFNGLSAAESLVLLSIFKGKYLPEMLNIHKKHLRII